MVRQRSKAFLFIAIVLYIAVGASLLGAISRIVGNYLGLMWGLIVAAIFGGIYLTYLYRLVRHLKKNSGRD